MTIAARESELLDALTRVPLVGILRRYPSDRLLNTVRAAIVAGLTAVEITMDSPDADIQIAEVVALVDELGLEVVVGAGTVTEPELAQRAVEAGASFLVAPDLCAPVIEAAHSLGRPIIPGVLTPTEVAVARRLGCSVLKLFPAGPMGTGYLRALTGPFADVSFVVTGGIAAVDVSTWLDVGAIAVGLGRELFPTAQHDSNYDLASVAAEVAAVRSAAAAAKHSRAMST